MTTITAYSYYTCRRLSLFVVGLTRVQHPLLFRGGGRQAPRRRRRRREACYLCKRGTHLGDREATGAVLLSLLAVPRIYPKSHSRCPLLELGLTPSLDSRCQSWDLQPPRPVSLRDAGFATTEVALGCGFSSARVWLCEDL